MTVVGIIYVIVLVFVVLFTAAVGYRECFVTVSPEDAAKATEELRKAAKEGLFDPLW